MPYQQKKGPINKRTKPKGGTKGAKKRPDGGDITSRAKRSPVSDSGNTLNRPMPGCRAL